MKQLKSRINEAVDVLCHGVPKRSKKVALSQWAFLVQSCGRWLFSELLKLPIRLGLSPQCGFASVWEGNPLTEAVNSCEFYQASCWNVLVTQGRAQEVDFSQWNSEAGLERCVIGCKCVCGGAWDWRILLVLRFSLFHAFMPSSLVDASVHLNNYTYSIDQIRPANAAVVINPLYS